ncbi:MAG: hypothetical protein GKR89_11990 [Candidatus Latescibacteria bacterium]|nr:hypothetical protein [Candidatus Latescibacterota bacterium]
MNALQKGLWLSQRLMGLVFLVAGATKIWQPVLFFWEAVPHAQILAGQEAWESLASMALLMGPLECLVGLALLVDWKPRLNVPVATVLMVFFVAITALAWQKGAEESCGCFGSLIERSPGEALVEDIIMLGLLVFTWWGLGRRPLRTNTWNRWVVVVGGLASLAILGFRYLPDRDRITQSDLQVGIEVAGLSLTDAEIDLTQGAYLVEFFSPKCSHCQRAVPKLNAWAADPDVPKLVALSVFDKDDPVTQQFKKHFQPRYTMAAITITDFMRMTRGHGYPRLAYIVDGHIERVWESDGLPNLDDLKGL